MIYRPDYMDVLKAFKDKPLVKILPGVRRCGKSTIFQMFKEELIREGVSQDHIIEKRYTDMDIPESITAKQMYDELVEAIGGKEHCYLLLDEIQEVPGWEKAINNLLEAGKADIYITGSNSKLMSSEISTYLTGRYIQIPVFTLSYKEYLEFKKESGKSKTELLEEYIRFGGFPIIALGEYESQQAYQIVNGIYYTVVSRDIVKRHRINKQDLFDEIVTDSIHFAHRIFHENENEKITVDSLFSDVEKEARIRFKRLQEEKLYLLLLSDAMKCDSEFSQKYTSGLKSILDQAATLFASAFALDDRKLAEQFASIFMATLDGFAIQQVLHAIPEDDTSYADTILDFFTTCVPDYIEKHRES